MTRAGAGIKDPPLTAQRRRSVSTATAHWLRINGLVVAVYVVAFALWQVVVAVFSVPVWILPSPLAIIESATKNLALLASNTWVTLGEVGIGFVLGTLISVPLGVALVYSKLLERIVYPFLVAFQSTPKIALAPILIVWFGFGSSPKVILALLSAAFPIVINTVIGMRQTPLEVQNLMRSFQASPWQTFFKARLPIASPYIFGGLKIGVTLAVVGAVVGEFIASNSGLGYLLLVANNNIDTPMMFAVVAVLAIMSSVLFYVIVLAEALLLPPPMRQDQTRLNPGASA